MTSDEKLRLRYRRQYILTPEKIECPFLCNTYTLTGNYHLYTHIDLKVTEYTTGEVRLILLGDMFDYESPQNNNSDILSDICSADFNIILNNTAKYTGRFILIHIRNNQISLMHDLIASRKIYYYKTDKGTFCSSMVSLIAGINKLEKTKDESKLSFYSSEVHRYLNNSNIGDTSIYDEVFQLLPNHYLLLNDFAISRYWIKKPAEVLTFDQTTEICARMLKGYVEAISHRYDIMLPLTAGKDSRTILSATYNIQDKVFYYINKEKSLTDKSNDINIPCKLINKLKLDFHVIYPYIEIDPDFEEVYYSNNESASPFYLPHIFNYYKNYPDKVNLPGNLVASGYDMYGKYDKYFSAKTLAKLNWVSKFSHAIDYYQRWLDGCKDFSKEHGIHLSVLFYWEERLANWGTQVHTDKDIAQEDIIPFNSRLLTYYFLSVDPKYIDRPYFQFFKKIMAKLWPEVLEIPVNPSFKNFMNKILYKLGIIDFIRKLILIKIIQSKPN